MPRLSRNEKQDGLILDLGDAVPTDYSALGLQEDVHAGRRLHKITLVSGFSLPLTVVGGLYGFVSGGWAWCLAGAAAGVLLGTLLGLFTHELSESAGDLLGKFIFLGSRPGWSLREKLSSDVQRIRYSMNHRQYGEALTIADQVLKQDPTHPEALYLKARALWDGFESPGPARECLRRLVASTPREDPHYAWAAQLYRSIRTVR